MVLVHGAFADASSWNGVVSRLKHDGYPVLAVANPLRSVSGDAKYLSSVLGNVHGPIVLVGHSYGGMVMTAAAAGNPNVKKLVYVAAFAPAPGESVIELAGRYPGSTLGETLVEFKLPDGGTDNYIDQAKFRHQFAQDVSADQASLMAATQRPIAAAALNEPMTAEPAWKTIPSWYVIPTADRNIPQAAQQFMAKRAHSHVEVVKGASHAVASSEPEAVARVIRTAATS